VTPPEKHGGVGDTERDRDPATGDIVEVRFEGNSAEVARA
jgi:hypothetical protein